MKKLVSILLIALTLLSTSSLLSCGKADIDVTYKQNVYSDLSEWINNPDEYVGKSVALTSTYTVVYNFSENEIIRHTLVEHDRSGEKRALYEIKKADGKYPAIGDEVTVIGTITKDRYIEVDSFSKIQDSLTVDIDTLTLSASELTDFIVNYRAEYSSSSNYGKSVRVFGHLSSSGDYPFLIGLDGDGKYLWEIELYDPTGSIAFPTEDGTTVNPVQIIGELTTYIDDNVTYACIKVESVVRIESVFKVTTES